MKGLPDMSDINWTAIEHFNESEFECPCCRQVKVDEAFIRKLDTARAMAGTPFRLSSAFRCYIHNHEVGGSETSSHLKGMAVDISCVSSIDRYRIIGALLEAGFNRIGIGSDFIHADSDPAKPSHVIWTY